MMNMKAVALLFFTLFFFTASYSQKKPLDIQKSQRIEKTINSQWTFNYFPEAEPGKGFELNIFDDSRWPAISLPHTWGTYETTGLLQNAPETEFSSWRTGWGWYRKHFSINSEFSGRKVFLELSDVRMNCKLWINGKYIGDHKAMGSFIFDITSNIREGADNLLVIAVSYNDSKNDFGGIYGDVKLILTDKLFFPFQRSADHEGTAFITTPIVSEKEATVSLLTYVKNDYPLKTACTLLTTISDASGKIIQTIKTDAEIDAGQLFRFEQNSKAVKNPHLWTTTDLYIYGIESSIIKEKIVTDSYSSPKAFRFIKSDAKENAMIEDTSITIKVKTNSDAGTTEVSSEPAVKILLSASQNKIPADRSSNVTIRADIADSKGIPTGSTNYTLKWNVSGPAKLTGPQIYDQSTGAGQALSNAIRSTGKPGKIHVSVSASGLLSGSIDIEAEEVLADNSIITEPVLNDDGRTSVTRKILNSKRLDAVPVEVKMISEEIVLSDSTGMTGYKTQIRDFIFKNNPATDTSTVEFNFLTDILSIQLANSEGRLQAEDYNFSADHFNNCRLIAGYINSTKLPQLFKDGLRKYYSDAIIKMGNEKDAGDEMNWLNWIPSGGTVVFVQGEKVIQLPKGAVLAKNNDLKDIISAVYPQFANFSNEAKERALLFTGKVNPYVHAVKSGDNQSYIAEKGQPILVPLIKFISE
jgi:hypothetical protein